MLNSNLDLETSIHLMKTLHRPFTCAACVLSLAATTYFGFAPASEAAPAQDSYKLLKEIPVGGEGSWDYLSVDTEGRRLYVSHGTKVVVVERKLDGFSSMRASA